VLREAVTSALPPGLLAQLLEKANGGMMHGRVGAEKQNMMRGRPRGARSGVPRGGSRLHLLETLRAAAPWQRARLAQAAAPSAPSSPAHTRPRVHIRREDFRIRRFIEKTGTTVLFVVDASGSSALNRLSEAKGAVEMLLAESYARRDRVSLIAFRGQGTELLLPPTRALARAKKVLAALPGGGGTPLAHAIDAALEQALSAKRAGSAPLVVMLTDGRANIARDGAPGRPGAERDALMASARFAQQGIPAMFVDTSARGEPVARRVAEAMRARYVLLPAANAKALGGLVRTAMNMAEGGDRA
jgi:magnesium chelatase subunit D